MGKILIITSGLSGILNSSFELIQRLEAIGHEVTYASLLDRKQRVEQQGFSYRSLPVWHKKPVATPVLAGGILNRFSTILTNYIKAGKRRALGIERLGQAFYKNYLNDYCPDLVLIDIECHEYIFTTYVSGFPLLLVSQWFNGQYAPGLPLITTLQYPAEYGVEEAWKQRRKEYRKLNWKRKFVTAGLDRRSLLLSYARQIGFPVNLLRPYNWPTPFTYEQIPILHFTDEQLELPHRVPENHFYLGPMVYETRKEQHADLQLVRRQLAAIYTRKEALEAKLIYCSVSTMSGSENGNFLEQVILACAKEPSWILILALGGLPEQLKQVDIPENCFVFSWLPQLEVLQHTDCSLNHAGINTINECIVSEVPMVVYSGEQYDQNGCAVRSAYHKLGVMGGRKEATPISIHRDISEVLDSSVYKERVIEANQRSRSAEVRNRLYELVDATMTKPKEQK